MGLSKEQEEERTESLKKLKITTFKEKKGYVFVSYKSDDWKKVFEEKVFKLQEKGMRVYSDKNFDYTNSPWLKDMEQNVRFSSVFLMFISEAYLESYATLIELLTAIKYHKEKQIVLVCLTEEDPDKMLERLCNNVDLYEFVQMKQGEETKLKELMSSISIGSGKYAEIMKEMKDIYEKELENQELTRLDIVDIFKKIFEVSDFSSSYNKFNNDIESLVNTIKDAAAAASETVKYSDVFEESATRSQSDSVDKKSAQSVKEELPQVEDTPKPEMSKPEQPKQEPPKVPYQDEEPVEVLSSQSETDEEDSISPKKGKVYSSTGDLTYELYGQRMTGNQSDMMIMCIGRVLKNNPDIIDEAINSFLCLAAEDYQSIKKSDKPSYFRVCHTFKIDGKTVCIGTSFGIKDKLRQIAGVIALAEEDPSVVKIEGLELPDVENRKSRGNESIVSYKLYGEEYQENQSLMMIRSISEVLKHNTEILDEALESFKILSGIDYEKIEKDERPSYFKVCRTVQIEGRAVCIGASCGKMSEKLRHIANIMAFAGEDPVVLSVDGYELPECKDVGEHKSRGTEKMVSYRLYGNVYESNQSVMLFNVISEVLKNNPEIINEAVDKIKILSFVDYEKMKVSDRENYFKNCRTYVIDGKTVCIGATCGKIGEKLRYIANLIALAEEDPFALELDGYELPEVNEISKRGKSIMVSYKMYGENHEDNQSDMMINVITEILRRNPGIVDQAEESISCLTNADYENVNRENRPSYFKNCETVKIGNKRICIGTALGINEKLRMISSVLALAQESSSVFEIDGYEMPQTSSAGVRGKKVKNYEL